MSLLYSIIDGDHSERTYKCQLQAYDLPTELGVHRLENVVDVKIEGASASANAEQKSSVFCIALNYAWCCSFMPYDMLLLFVFFSLVLYKLGACNN